MVGRGGKLRDGLSHDHKSIGDHKSMGKETGSVRDGYKTVGSETNYGSEIK